MTGAKIAATLDGGTSAWTDSLLGTAAWTDSTASDGTYASIDVTNGPRHPHHRRAGKPAVRTHLSFPAAT